MSLHTAIFQNGCFHNNENTNHRSKIVRNYFPESFKLTTFVDPYGENFKEKMTST